jgi:nucleotide-binding universal stress UspA family protein
VRAVVWIVEETWEATVDAAVALLPPDAEVELLHVTGEVEALVAGRRRGLLGRHPPPVPDPVPAALAEAEEALLADAAARLGRPATVSGRRGPAEHAVLGAARGADVLVVARDRDEPGPRSVGHATRFVVDHAPCDVILVRPVASEAQATT